MTDYVETFNVSFTFIPKSQDQYRKVTDWLFNVGVSFEVTASGSLIVSGVNPLELVEKIQEWGWEEQFQGYLTAAG